MALITGQVVFLYQGNRGAPPAARGTRARMLRRRHRGPARPGGAVPKGVERRVRESVGRSIRIRRVWRTTRCFRVSGSPAPVGVSSTRREQPESTVASRKRRLRKQFIKAAQVVPFCSPDAQTQLTAIKISFSISLVAHIKIHKF